MSLAGERVLVTGASGFIGRRLCRRLAEEGAKVWAASRSAEPPEVALAGSARGDLADPAFVAGLFSDARPSVVFHLASHVSGSRDLEAVLPTFRANLASTVHLLGETTRAGCRRVVVTGSLEEPEPSADDPLPVPASPYAASKGAAAAYGRMFHALYGTPVVHARLFMVYGPEQRDLAKLIPYVILSLLRGERPRLSSGRRPVDWIYVDDVVSGLLALATAPGVEGERLDLGSGELVTVREVVERVADVVRGAVGEGPAPDFGARPDRPLEQVRRAAAEATAARTGWKAEVSLEEGVRRTVEWYRE